MERPNAMAPISEILGAYWKSDRWMLLAVAAVVLLSSLASVAAPYVFSRLIDRLPQEGPVPVMIWGFVIYAALLGVAAALQHIVQYLSFMSAENLGFISGTQFFERILKKTSAFFVEYNPAEIQNASARGRGALTSLVQLGLIVFIPGVTQILLTLVTLGTLVNIEVAAIVVVYGTIAVTLTLISARRARVYLDKAIEAGQENARFVGNAMNAMETLRHFGSHRWMSRRFSAKALEVRDNWRAYVLQRVGYIAVLGLGLTSQFAVTFWLLLPRYQIGGLSIGDLVLFNTLLLQLNMPFEMIAHAIDDVARSRAALVPLATMWGAPEERQVSHAHAFEPREGHLVFRNVSYAYSNGRGVQDVSFEARRGGVNFLIGETGSGKSTIFKLALKSIEPDHGAIFVDDAELALIDRADWYSAVAVVPQDVTLLNESLADNIPLGRTRDEERLRRAAEKAAILAFIDALPDGFDTTVGERGLKLSGGERQRIAIARALYGNPAVLFLDEASSALDEATERDIMEHIRLLARNITVLAITHRKSVITPADNVVDLEKGRTSTSSTWDAAV
ncbi:ABC transporter ATP-binding protein [Rhizobium sp. BT-175]|uniref:ABC transporter ATP-binding protein n=1 Tax=Rhizobium sp. BT-175 TaxID=2986929 RepID=UPI002235C701|nr:ABC transporter ATP-binding protein [Rhizobium sp. BT-175]MCV9947459.1 ABC transporter ATP-binding protein/permease [Rhizobium sp. BT-175]